MEYGSQLWSPYWALQVKNINALEKVQRVFTKHIDRMHDLSYTERLKALQRRRDRYMVTYIWKILEGNVPNFSPPIKCHISAHSLYHNHLCSIEDSPMVPNELLISGCLAIVYSSWSAIVALHLSVIVFSLDLELRLLHSFGTIGESSIEHR